MIYTVDFCIKVNGNYRTVCKEYICAFTVTECKEEAEKIMDTLQKKSINQLSYFIEA